MYRIVQENLLFSTILPIRSPVLMIALSFSFSSFVLKTRVKSNRAWLLVVIKMSLLRINTKTDKYAKLVVFLSMSLILINYCLVLIIVLLRMILTSWKILKKFVSIAGINQILLTWLPLVYHTNASPFNNVKRTYWSCMINPSYVTILIVGLKILTYLITFVLAIAKNLILLLRMTNYVYNVRTNNYHLLMEKSV